MAQIQAEAPTESAGAFIARIGTDGALWAAEFCKHFPAVAEDDARAWFANAIECGRSAGYAAGQREQSNGS